MALDLSHPETWDSTLAPVQQTAPTPKERIITPPKPEDVMVPLSSEHPSSTHVSETLLTDHTQLSEHPTSAHSTKASPHVSEVLPSDHALQSFHSPVQTELDHSSPTPDYPDSTHSVHSTKTSPHISETLLSDHTLQSTHNPVEQQETVKPIDSFEE
jgi:hypothetical protein